MLIDLVILDTIIHKITFHIYFLNHSQKQCFQTNTSRHVYLVQYLHMFLQNHSQKNYAARCVRICFSVQRTRGGVGVDGCYSLATVYPL
jgi:hypothetical protein